MGFNPFHKDKNIQYILEKLVSVCTDNNIESVRGRHYLEKDLIKNLKDEQVLDDIDFCINCIRKELSSKGRNIDDFKVLLNEKRNLVEKNRALKESYEILKGEISALKMVDKKNRDTIYKLNNEISALNKRYDETLIDFNNLKKEYLLKKEEDEEHLEYNNKEENGLDMVNEIISLRDKLVIIKRTSEASNHEIFDGLYKELGDILTKSGVEILEDKSIRDDSYQRIISVVDTPDENLNEKIFDNFRCGYKYRGRLIRPQEVILYKRVENKG